jgi:hypothetical protein
MHLLPWALLAVGAGLLVYACRVLADDARGGYDVTMGGAGLYSGSWLVGSALAAAAVTMLTTATWWLGLGLFVVIYVAKSPVYRVIVARFLGRNAPPLPRNGFKEFMRKTETSAPPGRGEHS